MAIPTPTELCREYPASTPAALAEMLGVVVERVTAAPELPGVTVYSEFCPPGRIRVYVAAIATLARTRGLAPRYLEQWHIAHELYHVLAERAGISPWSHREVEADRWADTLLAMLPECVALSDQQ